MDPRALILARSLPDFLRLPGVDRGFVGGRANMSDLAFDALSTHPLAFVGYTELAPFCLPIKSHKAPEWASRLCLLMDDRPRKEEIGMPANHILDRSCAAVILIHFCDEHPVVPAAVQHLIK